MAGEGDLVLRDRQVLAVGDTDLFAHQVDPGDHLGHRVFDLQAGVHLDEVELAVFPQELDRPGAAIAHVGHRLRADAAHAIAFFRRDDRGGRFLEHFLVAPLERAVALAQVDRAAAPVAEHLKFDVARIAEILLDIDGRIAEGGLGLAPGLFHQAFELVLALADLHPAPAAAAGGLDDHRIADLARDPARLVVIGHGAVAAGHQRQAQRAGGALRLHLVAHRADMFGLGPDPLDVVRLDDLGELGVFRQEAVTGVDRVGLRDLRRRDDVGDVEIAVGGGRRADAHGVVGQAHVHGVGIGGRMDGDGLDAHLVRRAVDAKRDFAAVGNQDSGNAHGSPQPMTTSGWSNSTGCALSTRIALTVPALSAVIGFITFIASTISRVSPCFTLSPTLTKGSAPGSAAR